VGFWGGSLKKSSVIHVVLSEFNLFGTFCSLKRHSFSVQLLGGIQFSQLHFNGKSHENRIYRISYLVGCSGHHAFDRP